MSLYAGGCSHRDAFRFSLQKLLLQHNGLFFAPLALVVVNDDSVRCKKMAAIAIKTLLTQLDINRKDSVFALVNTWLNADKVNMFSHHKISQHVSRFHVICSTF